MTAIELTAVVAEKNNYLFVTRLLENYSATVAPIALGAHFIVQSFFNNENSHRDDYEVGQ